MSLYSRIKRLIVGKPIHSKHAHAERLPILYGLPVFASDALSSVAYASEEILLVLSLAGAAALSGLMPVSYALGALMLIVGFSYYQTIQAYPRGGGTYLVSTENLGSRAGRVAGAALLIDYILTVSVSVSAGVSAIISAYPQTQDYAVAIALGAIAILMIMNLRGAKESGIVFAIPTYAFVALMFTLIIVALVSGVGKPPIPVPSILPTQTDPLLAMGAVMWLRAFAASCTALTGTEAIADGVQAFKPPEARNAGITLVLMVTLLMMMFLGIGWSATHYGIAPMLSGTEGYKTVVAQLAAIHFGDGSALYFALQFATALILFLAANTAFADFPRLSQFIAKDGYLPRQLMSIGDRLVFQNGIILLAALAGLLIFFYHANTHSLMPLYAVGVFISFTLSQSGMVARALKLKDKAWKMLVSLLGAIVTGSVTIILLVTKFTEGAWLIVVALSVIITLFTLIKKHYIYLSSELSVSPTETLPSVHQTVLLLVPRLHRGVLQAIAYARSMAKDVRAIHVTLDPSTVGQIKEDWNRFGADIPLVILESPYRSFIEPIIDYIDQTIEEDSSGMITVIVPQAVPKRWYHSILHNNAAVPLKLALASRKNVVVTNVRYFLK